MSAAEYNIATLEVVNLELLRAQEPRELRKLLLAAQSSGFFYLDLRGENGAPENKLLQYLPQIYALSEKYFDQPIQSKLEDVRDDQNPSQDRGYVKAFLQDFPRLAVLGHHKKILT